MREADRQRGQATEKLKDTEAKGHRETGGWSGQGIKGPVKKRSVTQAEEQRCRGTQRLAGTEAKEQRGPAEGRPRDR